MLRLSNKIYGDALPNGVHEHDLGAYAGILSNWDIPEALAEPLVTACDYHCENLRERNDNLAEFDEPPFDLYPVEILAIYKVREGLGLETPKIDHPLMSTPLASLASRDVTPIDDPIIRRVERLYNNFFGEK
jgi:hypothetical protein